MNLLSATSLHGRRQQKRTMMKKKSQIINAILLMLLIFVGFYLYRCGIVFDEYATPKNWNFSNYLWLSFFLIFILYFINWLSREKVQSEVLANSILIATIIGFVFILFSVVNTHIVLSKLMNKDPELIQTPIEETIQYKKEISLEELNRLVNSDTRITEFVFIRRDRLWSAQHLPQTHLCHYFQPRL